MVKKALLLVMAFDGQPLTRYHPHGFNRPCRSDVGEAF